MSAMPLLVMAWTSIQSQNMKHARLMAAMIRKASTPNMPDPIIPHIASIRFLSRGCRCYVFCSSAGHLLEQFLELDASEALDDRRKLRYNLRHVSGQLARAAAHAIARVDDDHLLRP